MTDAPQTGGGRRGRSLLTRIGAIVLATVVAVGTIAVAFSARIVERQQLQALLRRAELVAAMQADALSGPVWELDARTALAMIAALRGRDPAIRTVTVHESAMAEPLARTGEEIPGEATSTIEQPILLRSPDGGARTVGTLRLVYSTAEVRKATENALLPLVGLLLLSLLTSVAAIGTMFDRIALRPLRRLTQAAQALAAGDYGARPPAVARDDEIGVLTRGFTRMAETVQEHTRTLESRVRERTEALAETNRRIMDSINYAQLIQSSILPKPEVLGARLVEHFVLWRPRDVVSGDFYYCREVADGIVLGVADCTGHGVPGAFMTMTASAILNNVIDTMGADDPAAVLAAVDRKVRAALHQDGAATVAEGGFDNGLDLALCRIRPDQGHLVFAGARIPLLIAGPDGVAELRGDRHSLGYRHSGEPPAFTNHTVDLRPGQTFYLHTDGLTDQNGGERGRGFGRRRLRELIAGCLDRPLDQQRLLVERSLAGFQGGHAQRDDITLVGFRVRRDEPAGEPVQEAPRERAVTGRPAAA